MPKPIVAAAILGYVRFQGQTVYSAQGVSGIAAAIVLKNAAFYQHQDRQNPLRKAGHTLEDLPSYSPVLNPIQQTPVGADQRYP